LEDAVSVYLEEWLRGLPPAGAEMDWYRENVTKDIVILGHVKGVGNWINREGDRELWTASRLLLQRMSEQRRLTKKAARRCLVDAHFAHLPKALKTSKLSEHAVIAGATKRLEKWERSDGFYVILVCFAPSAKNTRFRIGPAIILAKAMFQCDYGAAISAQTADPDSFGSQAVAEWSSYSEPYDHFVIVEISGHETEMAWKAARDVADYVLNLIRMKFGYYHMDDVRIGNGFIWETTQAQVYFDKTGSANFRLSRGPRASHLDDNWVQHFDEDFGSETCLFGSLASWMASGDDPMSPVLERLRYANALIAEAFGEPHDRIRLVRLVAALEALAALPREEKSEKLAWRCAFAGGWTDCGRAVQIVDDILYGYTIRNAVVHGESPDDEDAISAFYRLERHLARIYIGFLHLYAKIQRCYRPIHVRHIRRAFDRHIESFFWNPDEVW
jgi:hypothetical protein